MPRDGRTALVLAGGAGERFWPMSTTERPKQLLSLGPSGKSLLADSVDRMRAVCDDVWIAASPPLLDSVRAMGLVPEGRVLAEPARRNTAGAIVWAVGSMLAVDPGLEAAGVLAIAPADHLIQPAEAFAGTLEAALDLAEGKDRLVAIGIRPDRPETGFGYIEVGAPLGPGFEIARFVEKPIRATAERMLAQGGFLWNAGIFVWTVRRLLSEMRAHAPAHLSAVRAVAEALAAGDAAEATDAFESLPSVSIDVAIMEKTSRAAVVPAGFEWDDLGAWDALSRALPRDERGNVALGPVRAVDSAGCVAASDGPDVCLLGVQGLVVVAANGKVLVCPANRAQEVRGLGSE